MLYIWIMRYFVNLSLNLREKDFYLNVDRNFLFPTRKIRRVYIYIYNCTDKALSLKVFYVVGNFTRILSKRKIDDCTISLRFVALPVKCVEIPRQQGDLLIRLLLASYTKTFTGRGIRKSWWRISSRFLATIVKIITRQDRLDNVFRKEMEIWASASVLRSNVLAMNGRANGNGATPTTRRGVTACSRESVNKRATVCNV